MNPTELIVTFDATKPETSIFDSLRGFISRIVEEPEADDIRLICADYLEERGHELYARFIREQITNDHLLYGKDVTKKGKSAKQRQKYQKEKNRRLKVYRNCQALLLRGPTLLPPLVTVPVNLSGLLTGSLGLTSGKWFATASETMVSPQIIFRRGFPDKLVASVRTFLMESKTARSFFPHLLLLSTEIRPRHHDRLGRPIFSFWHDSRMSLDNYLTNGFRDWVRFPVWSLPTFLFEAAKNAPGSTMDGDGRVEFQTNEEALAAISGGLASISDEMTDKRRAELAKLSNNNS